MNSYQIILKLIEVVDPSDTANLDNIDTFVHILINDIAGNEKYIPPRQYTRNRDALKAIRPEGWWFECCKICDGTYMAELHDDRYCTDDDEGITVKAWYRQNEELAELHAIIQAIAYERGSK